MTDGGRRIVGNNRIDAVRGHAIPVVGPIDRPNTDADARIVSSRNAFRRRMLATLGLRPLSDEADLELLKALFGWMGATRAAWPQVFFDWFGGAASEAVLDARGVVAELTQSPL